MGTHLFMVWAACLVSVAVAMSATAVLSRRLGRVSIVDVVWPLLFILVAWVSYAVGTGSARSLLVAALVTVWGGRLARHIWRRALGAGEDPRYEKILAEAPEGKRFGFAVRKVFLVQALAAWFVSLPVQVAAATNQPLGWIAALGVLVWILGVTFEAVGDAQLSAFKADPATKGTIMDRGLWAWTRHPNYFGDSAVWWGLFFIAAEAWPGVLTVLSPVLMTYFLAFATGARLLESEMAKRQGYTDYQRRTSMFFPLPPKRS